MFRSRPLPRAGAIQYDRGKIDAALADFTEAIRLDPGDAKTHYGRSCAWYGKMEYDKVIADCTQAVRLDPGYASAYRDRGGAWYEKKEYDKAIADFTEAIRINPRSVSAHHWRGDAWYCKGEYDRAIADWTEAIRLDPGDAWARRSRGDAWYERKDYDKAIADWTEAIRLDPADTWSYDGLAWLRATCPDEMHRDGKEAVESATRACELSGWKKASFLDTLAAACAEVGDFAKAIEWQEKANGLFADEKDREEGRSRLKLYKQRCPYREDERRVAEASSSNPR